MSKELKTVLFYGDGHIDNQVPLMRKDDYMLSGIEELAEGLRTARDNHCDLFVHLGDVFHRIEVSPECRNLVIATLAEDENGKPWPFEKYTIVGNHDIDHNIQNLKRSSLASLIKSGLLKCVDDIPEYRIGFGHFRESLEQEMKDGYCQEGNNLIWAVHANVTVDDFFESANYIKFCDTPLNDECKLLVSGHIHFPLSQKREDGKQFINPGSVSRREAISENFKRQPKLLLVKYSLDGSIMTTEEITMTTPQPAELVFKMDEIQARSDKKHDTQIFAQNINAISITTTEEDKYEMLRKAGTLKKIRKPVLDLAIQTTKEVNERRADTE